MKNTKLLFSIILIVLAISCRKEEKIEDLIVPCHPSVTENLVIDQLSSEFTTVFSDADPEINSSELDHLIEYLGNVSLVGLGEATHGTAEFFSMKDKLFRQLVTRKGFKAIIFEIPWGNAIVVNDFVLGGTGSVNQVIDQTYYWVYDTKEVRNLAQWIHDYNENLPAKDKIYFVGCDPQGKNFNKEIQLVEAFLQKVALDSTAALMANYDALPFGELYDYSSENNAIHQANINGTTKVYEFLKEHKKEFIGLSSELEYEIALMAAHVIKHREELYRKADFGVPRDSLMAIYSEWWQSILGEDAKVAIWAHNLHVMDGADFNAYWMGTYLKQRHADQYKNVAFSFGKGAFNAFLANKTGDAIGGIQRQVISNYECGTVNFLLSEVEGDQHYLIFDELEGDVRQYFTDYQPFIHFGAGFNKTYIDNYTRPFRLAYLFDVLIHFDETRESELQ